MHSKVHEKCRFFVYLKRVSTVPSFYVVKEPIPVTCLKLNLVFFSFDLVEITGKNQRKVPVILTEDVKSAIAALNQKREEGGVDNSNPYVFAVNDGRSTNSLRGHDVLQNSCNKVKLEKPELVKSTNLRKYVATVSQLVDMNESEMGWLANHMGHDIHVHKEYYRLPQTTIEMAVVGNLLMAVDEGRAHQFKGKTPRQLNLAGNYINSPVVLKIKSQIE